MKLQQVKGPGFFSNCYVYTKADICRQFQKTTSYLSQIAEISLRSFIVEDGKETITLTIECRNLLQIPFIVELLQSLEFKTWQYSNSQINVCFDLTHYSKVEMNDQLTRIFARLRSIGLSSADEAYFLNGITQCLLDFDLGFTADKQSRSACEETALTVSGKKDMEGFVLGAYPSKKELWRKLQEGYDPNSTWYGFPILTLGIISRLAPYHCSEVCDAMILLIMYGANPYQTDIGGRTFEDHALSLLSDDRSNDRNYLFGRNLVRILTGSRNARPFTHPHSSDQTSAAKLIREGNTIIEKRNTPLQRQLFSMKPKLDVNPISIDILDEQGKLKFVVTVLSKKVEDLSERWLTQMYNLYRKFPGLKGNEETCTPAYFNKHFIKTGKETHVDLLIVDRQLVGYCMSEVTDDIINGQAIKFHNITLAQRSDTIQPYKRLMTLVSSMQGFVLQQKNRGSRVVTHFEAASEASYMQVRDLDFYPLLLRDFIALINKFYPNALRNENNIPMYISDPLAHKAERKDSPEWFDPASLALKFYDIFLASNGRCLLLLFDNSPENLARLAKSMGTLVGTTLSEMVEKVANPPVDQKEYDDDRQKPRAFL